MIVVDVKDAGVLAMLSVFPVEASRALETAIDKTALAIRNEIRQEMKKVFDRPTPYTLNSLQVTPTRNHNMKATVWFKDPERMHQHYLIPQVEGGKRKLKGFERAIGKMQYVPGSGVKLDKYGNVTGGMIKQILSVLGLAETSAGFQSNITARSAKRNKAPRDYVFLPRGSGRLPPGIYQRFVQGSTSAGRKAKRVLPFGEWQKGKTKGRFVRARGLRPILVKGRRAQVKPRLSFYAIADRVYNRQFKGLFETQLRRFVL